MRDPGPRMVLREVRGGDQAPPEGGDSGAEDAVS